MARLLVVDDNADQLELRRLICERAGYEVVAAASAGEALRAAAGRPPDAVVMDLRLPEAENGIELMDELRRAHPGSRIVVLTGFPADLGAQAQAPDAVLVKPFPSQDLLKTLARLVVVLMCIWVGRASAADIFRFQVSAPAEVRAEIEMSSPGSDWGEAGREAAVAELWVDGRLSQHVMLWAGGEARSYPVFLGRMASGAHELRVERSARHSAGGSRLEVRGARFHEAAAGSADYDALAHAPVLFARANTIGRFSDIPLMVYCERLSEGGRPLLQYTVVFSNEDGGTSTRALMARWGRTTDIEYVYKVWPGEADHATIQTRDHKEVRYAGRRENLHPLLVPVTDNNMVAPDAPTAIRYQVAPVTVDLASASRERVMDGDAAMWRAMSVEMAREAKLRAYGTVDGNKISDPRNYLYVEAAIRNRDSRITPVVRLRGEDVWRSAHLGRADYAIERDGWIRSAIELPPGTAPAEVAGIGFQCLVEERRTSGECRVDRVRQAFLLDREYRPLAPLWKLDSGVPIKSGEIRVWSFASK